jgi:hypothetical protein
MVVVGMVASVPVSAAADHGTFAALQAAQTLGTTVATPSGPNTPLIGCGASANDSWTNATNAFSTVRECSLTVPDDGLVFVSADATVVSSAVASQGEFDVSIDSTTSGVGAPRWVTIRDDGSGGQKMSLARTAMTPLSTGSHTIRLLGKSSSTPAATVRLDNASLSAIFIPGSSDLLACYDDDSEWNTTSTSYSSILKCGLTAPENGWAFITADATVRWQDLSQDLELAFEFDDTPTPEGATRFLGAHTGTWSFSPAALSMLKPVKKGARTFTLVGRRDKGTGQIDVYYPSLNVIYIPSSSAYAISCGEADADLWSTTSNTWQGIEKCSLTAPTDTWAFVSASSSVNYSDGPFQGQFQVRIDDDASKSASHAVNIYSSDDFGKDNTVAVSVLKPIADGAHTFNFRGQRASGTGTMQLYRPTLTAIVPLATLPQPVLDSPADGAALCSGQPTLTWTAAEGATSHRVHVDDDPAFGSIALDETVMGTSYTLTAAQELPGGVYYWRVRGSSPVQTGPWSATRSFSVGPPTAKVSLSSPPNGSDLCGSHVFGWAAGEKATGYDIEVDNSAGFASPEIDDNTTHPDVGYEPASELAPDTYTWHVRSTNTCGDGPWSDPWNFTVPPAPGVPTLLSPVDESAIENSTPTLTWTTVAGATTYFVQVSQEPDFGSLEIDSFSATTSYTVPGSDALAQGTYYWKVRAEDGCRAGDWSSAWKLVISSFDHKIYLPLVMR